MCYYFRHFTYSAIFSIQIPAWILALFASVPSAAQDNIMVKFEANSVNEQQLTELAYSPAWLRLIHYQGNGTSFQSELDGQGFFLAPDGKTNPLAELKANLAAFSQEEGRLLTQFKLHPQCAFPERFRLVQSSLNISLKIKDCPLYESFLKRFHGPTGVSLVFSSAYPNNPGSMFGHTFLKIRSQRKNPLLDTGINFAAWTPRGVNMLAFMYLGVFGGYRGLWSADPYFKKVNEYINSESRDLWEYKLTLNPEETRRLVAHFWELEMNSHFDYYFFDKNCSYQILRAIEAIRTDWDLTPYRIYVIPGETVKQVGAVPNTIREVNFRPSLFHQLETSYNYLNKKERAEYQLLVQGKKMTESPASVNALDAALLGLLFRKAKLKKKWTSADQEIEDSVLQQRSQQPEKSAEVELPRHYLRSRPDLGHDSYSLQIGGGYRERPEAPSISNSEEVSPSFARFKLRSAYHDLLANDLGYSPFSELEFPWIEFHWTNRSVRLQEVGIVSSTSLFPLTDFEKRASWRLRWAFETETGGDCFECLLGVFEGGYGLTLGNPTYRLYTLILGRAEVHSRLNRGYRLRPGLEPGWIWNPMSDYKLRILARIFWSESQASQWERHLDLRVEHSLSLQRNQEIRQSTVINYNSTSVRPTWIEAQLKWILYFR